MTKKDARNQMKEFRNQLSEQEVRKQSELIMKQIISFEPFRQAKNILIYVSFGKEVETIPLIKKLLTLNSLDDKKEMGHRKNCFVPRVDNQKMDFYKLHTYEDLKPGFYGILEPVQLVNEEKFHQSMLQENEKPLLLMPGLAFDKQGNRVGYGGGYYDQFLSTYGPEHFLKVALAFDEQVVDFIETDEFDCKIDYCMTPNQKIEIKK